MPTINSKTVIDNLITNNGYYTDDPRAIAIHFYINNWGNLTYHVAYFQREIESLFMSPFCHDIKLVWSIKK